MPTNYRFPIRSTQSYFFTPGSYTANSGALFVNGRNSYGQLGLGDTNQIISPVQTGSFTTWKQVAHNWNKNTLAIDKDNNLWAWGHNGDGQLGLGDRTHRSTPVQLVGSGNWKQVTVGESTDRHFSLAIKNDGTLWSWGNNAYGNLGLNDLTHRSSPVQVGSLTNWKQVATDAFVDGLTPHSAVAAVKTDGTLWTWGRNTDGRLGLNQSVPTEYSSPVQVGALTNWSQVSVAWKSMAAVKTDGTIWTWGHNSRGQLGLGDRDHRSSPVQVGSLTNWKQVSCFFGGVAAVKTDGTLWAWGQNYSGELGQSSLSPLAASSPIQVGSLTNWSQVFARDDALSAVKTDGTLWSWGRNESGKLGLGNTTHRSSPVQVGSLTNWISNVDGYGTSSATLRIAGGTVSLSDQIALTTENFFVSDGNTSPTYGALFSWGGNSYGELGQNDRTHRSSPVRVSASSDWKQVSGGRYIFSVIKTDGTLWSWGNNTNGGLGDGTITHRSSPVQIGSLTNWSLVASGFYFMASIKTDGTLWTWGDNTNGQLGQNNITHRSSPVQVGSLTNWSMVSCGGYSSVSVKTDGTLWAWGRNNFGQLGDGTITHRSSPVQIGSLTNWSKVSCGTGSSHSAAIKTDGTLWTWGLNNRGQLGDGTITHRSSPVQIGSLTNWSKVSCGLYSTAAIKTDGSLWVWGSNNNGELALGDITHRSSPVQVGSLTDWRDVSYGENHAIASKTDGTLWSWGRNHLGQLGQGDTINRSSPVLIGSGYTWLVSGNLASDSTLAIASGTMGSRQIPANLVDMEDIFVDKRQFGSDPNLWMWGDNVQGQLGVGDRTHRSSPVQVGSLSTWKQVSISSYSHTAAIKTDGTLWTWGRNQVGQLGLGDITHRSSPVQVGSLTNWKWVVCAGEESTAAIKTDGTLWTWGKNSGGAVGALGLGDRTDRSSPTQVGTLTDWSKVFYAKGNYGFAFAVKTDGTLWAWGANYYNYLGLNDTIHRSSPVQVGSLTNWKQAAGGQNHGFAVKTDGTLWAWGRNSRYQLGLGNNTNTPSPTQVGTQTNWKLVSSGQYFAVAVKTDGTVWSWGEDNYGSLGIGSAPYGASTPTQIGTLTNWKSVDCGTQATSAIKTDGTLWNWGRNEPEGQLGISLTGDNNSRSSPVQVGALTNWKSVARGAKTAAAIAYPNYNY